MLSVSVPQPMEKICHFAQTAALRRGNKTAEPSQTSRRDSGMAKRRRALLNEHDKWTDTGACSAEMEISDSPVSPMRETAWQT